MEKLKEGMNSLDKSFKSLEKSLNSDYISQSGLKRVFLSLCQIDEDFLKYFHKALALNQIEDSATQIQSNIASLQTDLSEINKNNEREVKSMRQLLTKEVEKCNSKTEQITKSLQQSLTEQTLHLSSYKNEFKSAIDGLKQEALIKSEEKTKLLLEEFNAKRKEEERVREENQSLQTKPIVEAMKQQSEEFFKQLVENQRKDESIKNNSIEQQIKQIDKSIRVLEEQFSKKLSSYQQNSNPNDSEYSNRINEIESKLSDVLTTLETLQEQQKTFIEVQGTQMSSQSSKLQILQQITEQFQLKEKDQLMMIQEQQQLLNQKRLLEQQGTSNLLARSSKGSQRQRTNGSQSDIEYIEQSEKHQNRRSSLNSTKRQPSTANATDGEFLVERQVWSTSTALPSPRMHQKHAPLISERKQPGNASMKIRHQSSLIQHQDQQSVSPRRTNGTESHEEQGQQNSVSIAAFCESQNIDQNRQTLLQPISVQQSLVVITENQLNSSTTGIAQKNFEFDVQQPFRTKSFKTRNRSSLSVKKAAININQDNYQSSQSQQSQQQQQSSQYQSQQPSNQLRSTFFLPQQLGNQQPQLQQQLSQQQQHQQQQVVQSNINISMHPLLQIQSYNSQTRSSKGQGYNSSSNNNSNNNSQIQGQMALTSRTTTQQFVPNSTSNNVQNGSAFINPVAKNVQMHISHYPVIVNASSRLPHLTPPRIRSPHDSPDYPQLNSSRR